MNISGKRVFIIGAGRSGVAAALLAKKNGAYVFVSDSKEESVLGENVMILRKNGIDLETGKNSLSDAFDFDMVVLSPGVHLDGTVKREFYKRGVSLISELEFAYRFIDIPVIAITGTNGKSTTTALIGHIIGGRGRSVFVGGNIGNPLSNLPLMNTEYECAVVEVSSFMLEDIDTFRPQITVFTNISIDHLDKYRDYDEYRSAKLNIFRNLDNRSCVIINGDCEELALLLNRYNVVKRYFSKSRRDGVDAFAIKKDDSLHLCIPQCDKMECIEYKNQFLIGEHNLENVLAASLAAAHYGVNADDIKRGVNSFAGLEHRIEFVREINGVRFYNDSKATNIDSAIVALKSFNSDVIWIAGGRHKGTPYTALKDIVYKRVKKLIAIGEAAELIYNDLKEYTDVDVIKSDLREAVRMAFSVSQSGDSVLFSPACSSYDMFSNYEERGKAFKDIVRRLG